ncbi:MAG: MBL fold metallo-hydrolase [Clostridia bacterium]|nr:MBL fold metallo-hydrolase [Clostridia bacterium]
MNDWFTVEKIDSETFAISEYKHFEQTHCYLLLGNEKAVIIDTGLGVSNIKNVVDGITSLPVIATSTHVHWDHIGGHHLFDKIAVFKDEKEWLEGNFPLPLNEVKKNLTKFPCDFPLEFDVENYKIYSGKPDVILNDGDTIDLGGRKISVIHTPGHSPGHCCFYERERGYLFSGDLIYRGCLDTFYPTTSPELFFRSIRKIKSYQIKRILPAHYAFDIDVSVIEEIEEAFSELNDGGKLCRGSGIFDFGNFKIHL